VPANAAVFVITEVFGTEPKKSWATKKDW